MIILGLISAYFIQPESLKPFIADVQNGTYETLADGQRVVYIDIDKDQNSEQIIYYHLSDNRQPVINQYSSTGEFQNVWYLEGEVAENFDFISGDYNNDGLNEVFVFSFYRNNLCLYGLKLGRSNQFITERKAIYSFKANTDLSHIAIHSGGIVDLNNDSYGEVVFSVNSRYTNEPRCVYAYDISNDTLHKSPNFELQLVGQPIIYDINNDKSPEIFLSTLNSTNQAWTSELERAQHSASVVLQSNLTYFFVPVLYETRMSVSSTFPIVGINQNYIGSLSWPLNKSGKSRLLLLNQNGEIIKQKKLANESFVFDPNRHDWSEILLFHKKGLIESYNEKLINSTSLNIDAPIHQVAYLDIDGDNTEESILVQNNKLTIYRSNFTNPVTIDIPGLNVQKVNFSVNKNRENGNKLSIQNYNQQYLISYSKNQFYWLQYFIYILVVLIYYFIYYLISQVLNIKVNKIKGANETFYQMQMELVKNQLDPHFLFNALNSISFSINKDERKTAYSNVGLFSKFLRESIVALDEFSRTLQEEIDYVKNYLALEKFRFKEKFDYDFIISPGINLNQKVPKLVLFSFIESALKKGILPQSSAGRIQITIDNNREKGVFISISDTGLYRNISDTANSHTKNMQMMSRIVAYFNQHNFNKIEISYKDLGDKDNPKGSSIEIIIPPDYKYII